MAHGDANLLFGIFAVQLQLVTPQQLAAAGAVWATDQTRRLADILVEQGVLSDQDRGLIGQLIERQVQAAGGDEFKVYQAFGGDRAAQRSFGGSLVFDKPQGGKPRYVSIGPPTASQPTPGISGGEAGGLPQSISDSLPPEQPGRYELRSEQGRGGIGRVLLAYDSAIGREIALKELIRSSSSVGSSAPGTRSSAQTVRFLREARITGQLEHPGIVPVYELGRREDGTVYYTMKLVRGETMADQLQASSSLGDRLSLLHHFVDLCEAIAYAHSRGVIHRDIKPANVMVGEFGETLLLDWGLAKVKGQKDEGAEKLLDEVRVLKEAGAAESFVGKPIGTPSYMPPEQADGRIDDINERSDVWSLGVVLYEILTGGPPFLGSNAFEVIGQVLSDPVVPVLERAKDAPPELAAIAMHCLERDPARRYQSVEQLADDIKSFQTGGLVSAYSYNTALMLRRWAGRHKVELATGAVALLLLLALGVFSYGKVLEQRNTAVNALARLDKRNNELLGLQLATQSREQLAAGHTERATLLALEGARFYGKSDPWMPEIDRSLRDCVGAPYFAHVRQYFDANQDGVAFLRDGKRMATVCGIGMVVWDLSRPQEIPAVYPQGIERVVASPDGKWLATGKVWSKEDEGKDKAKVEGVLLWDAAALEKDPHLMRGSVSDIRSLAFSADSRYLAAGAEEPTVRIWDLQQPAAEPILLRSHKQKVMSLAFSPDGKWLASTSADATICLWDRSDFTAPPRVLLGHADQVYSAVFTSDSRTLITCAQDDTVRFWSIVEPAAPPQVLEVHTDTDDIISGVALDPIDTRLAVACYDERAIRLYPLAELQQALDRGQRPPAPAILRGHEDGIDVLTFSLDGKLLASGAHDHTVRVWELDPPHPEPQQLGGQSQAMAVALSPDGKLVAGAGSEPELALWDLAQSSRMQVLSGSPERRGRLPVQPDKAPTDLTPVRALVLQANKWMEQTIEVEAEAIMRAVAFSPDGRWLAGGSFDGLVRLWDLQDLVAGPRAFKMHAYHIRTVAFSADSRWLVSGGEKSDEPLFLLDLANLDSPPLTRSCGGLQPRSIAFSPDGKFMAVGGGKIHIYSMADLSSAPRVLSDHAGAVTGLCYSADGKLLASSSWDGTARLWLLDQPDTASKVFKAKDGWLYSVALTPDGRYLAAGGKSNLVRVWDTARPEERPEILLGFGGTVTGLVFSPDGKLLYSSSVDSRLRIWRINHDDLVQVSSGRVWRNLTLQEWQTYIGRDRPYEQTLRQFPPGANAPGSPFGR